MRLYALGPRFLNSGAFFTFCKFTPLLCHLYKGAVAWVRKDFSDLKAPTAYNRNTSARFIAGPYRLFPAKIFELNLFPLTSKAAHRSTSIPSAESTYNGKRARPMPQQRALPYPPSTRRAGEYLWSRTNH